MKFNHILCDPPWQYNDRSFMRRDGQPTRSIGANLHYDTMSTQDLCDIGKLVYEVSDEDCLLHLWACSPLLSDALRVISAWGFSYCSVEFVWMKISGAKDNALNANMKQTAFFANYLYDNTTDMLDDLACKLPGHYSLSNIEMVLVARRGKMPQIDKMPYQMIFASRQEHSRKPDDAHIRLDAAYPGTNKLEMFARRDYPGWHCIGNECPSTYGQDIKQSLKELDK